MDQPKIPTLKDAQKPQVKIKGMGAGVTIFDRLKQFKKKDLAFILAGLGTLFMAPLAEHFMMAPEGGASDMSQGFRGPGGGGNTLFGGGSSPYENGNNSIAQGGAIGGAGDIITPLNVRDPSALVMGPGAAQQPPAGSAAPPVAPAPPKSDPDYGSALKDAVKGGAARAAGAAVSRSPLPVPKVALGGSGLRGLGVAGGGTSATGGVGPVGPAAGGTSTGGGNGLNLVRANPNFRGAAGPRSPTGPGGLDGTKKGGQNAGDQFNRTGSALGGLNAAADTAIPTGGSGSGGGGMGGAGANDKGPGGSGAGGSKSVGESLAFIEAKERMMENLKYEFEMRKLKDPQRLMYEIRNDSLKAMASELTKTLTKGLVGLLDGSQAPNAPKWECDGPTGKFELPLATPKCADSTPPAAFNCFNTIGQYILQGSNTPIVCRKTSGGKSSAPGSAETAPSTPPSPTVTVPPAAEQEALNVFTRFCTDLRSSETMLKANIGGAAKAGTQNTAATSMGASAATDLATVQRMLLDATKVASAKQALYKGGDNECGKGPLLSQAKIASYGDKTAAKLYAESVNALIGDGKNEKGGIGALESDVGSKEGKNLGAAKTKIGDGETALASAEKIRQDADGLIKDLPDAPFVSLSGAPATFAAMVNQANAARVSLKKLSGETDSTLSSELKKLVDGSKLAGVEDKNPAKAIVEKNKSFDEKLNQVKDLGGDVAVKVNKPAAAAPAAGGTTTPPAPTEWAAVRDGVNGKIEAVVYTTLDEKIKAAKDEQDPDKKKTLTTDASTELQTVYDKLTAMQSAQTEFLTGLRTGIGKAGRPEGTPATPAVAGR